MRSSSYVPVARRPMRRDARGLTLIEMLVALVVASILSLAVFAVLSISEGRKRTTTAVNDTNQAGNYALYAIDKWVRSAGSGFVQSGLPPPEASAFAGSVMSYGCRIFAARNNVDILPRGTGNPPPAPFASVTTGVVGTFRLAPVLIAPGQSAPGVSGVPSDVLIVMSGAGGYGEAPIPSRSFIDESGTAFAAANELNLSTGVSLAVNDVVLIADQPGGSGVGPCMIQQVASVSGGTIGITNGTGYGKATIGSGANSATVTSYSTNAVAMNMGNIAGGNAPAFLLIGVGDNNTLFSYDLLQTNATAAQNLQAIADGVFELQALYGVDTDNDGRVDSWQDPGDPASNYRMSELMAGTPLAAQRIAQIKALRVGLILRTSLPEREQVAPASLTMFSDLGAGLTYTRNLTAAERVFRYRVVESTIPLRNAMLVE